MCHLSCCTSEDKEVKKICPALKVVSSAVIEIFTSNVWAKQSGHSGAENRAPCGQSVEFS